MDEDKLYDYNVFCKDIRIFLNDKNNLDNSINIYSKDNIETRMFLDALSACLLDNMGGEGWFNNYSKTHISYKDLFELIKTSCVYE